VRSVAVALAIVGLLLAAATPASAKWVWRDGRWVHVEDAAPPAEPQPPAATTPAPTEPAPEPPQPAPEAPEPEAPAPPAPAPSEPEPPAPAVSPTLPAPAAPIPPPPVTATPAPVEAAPSTGSGQAPASEPAPAASQPEAAPSRGSGPAPAKRGWFAARGTGDEKALFEKGRSELVAGNYRAAARILKDHIAGFPASANREEAMWLRGAALLGLAEHYAAFEQYEALVTQYAGSPHYRDALAKEMEIAEVFLQGTHRKVLGLPLMISAASEGIEILRKVYEHQPTGDLAEKVVMRIADYHRAKSEWSEAEDYYDKYCKEFPNGAAARHAELERAKCTIERCRGPRYDTASLQLAYDRLVGFQRKFPEEAEQQSVGAMIERVRDMQAEGLFRTAEHYARAGQPLAAAYYAERLQARFPNSPWTRSAGKYLAAPLEKQEPKP